MFNGGCNGACSQGSCFPVPWGASASARLKRVVVKNQKFSTNRRLARARQIQVGARKFQSAGFGLAYWSLIVLTAERESQPKRTV
jgi:hypothetical protein